MENISQPIDVNVVDLGDESSVSLPLELVAVKLQEGVLPCLRFLLLLLTPRVVHMKKSNGPRLLKFGMILNLFLVGGIKKSQCMWCKRLFAVTKSSTTSTISRQLSKCVTYMESTNKKQQTLSLNPSDTKGLGTLSNFSFNEKKVQKLASHMVLFHKYSFNFIEHEIFNKFMKA